MSVFDIDALLMEIDPENPTGDDLEFDPGFIEMETLASSGGDQSIIEGADDASEQATDWKGVRKSALALFGRTKDLRATVFLARSAIVCDGLAGFCDAVSMISSLLEHRWEEVHPQLDPDDDNDPTMRVNILAMLCGKSETLDLIAAAPLVSSLKAGIFSFRDVQVAAGDVPPPVGGQDVPTMALITAASLDCELDSLSDTATALSDAIEHVRVIDQVLTEKVGSAQAADLQPLIDVLAAMGKFVGEQLAARGVNVAGALAEGEESGEGATSAGAPASGEIHSRADAIRMMDKISTYYLAQEPSSPIPLLMQRAKRLSSMDFLGIIKNLASDGLSQAENIAGPDDSE